MTDFETFFLQTTDYLNKIGLDYFLHGSTLLRIIRDNTVEPRIHWDETTPEIEGITHDREINIAVLAEDFTDKIYMQLKRDYPYFNPINNYFPNALIFYGQNQVVDHMTQWDLRPGFTLIARYWEGKNTRIEYMGDNHCLVFPKKMFEKEKWGKVKILGREFNCPSNPEEYLSFYFGKDWREENQGWHWSSAECYQTMESLGGGEIYV